MAWKGISPAEESHAAKSVCQDKAHLLIFFFDAAGGIIHCELVPAGTNSKQALLLKRDGTSAGACAVSDTSSSETTDG